MKKTRNPTSGLVYSTDPDSREKIEAPVASAETPPEELDSRAKKRPLQFHATLQTGGRAGKTVTQVRVNISPGKMGELLHILRIKGGMGGTIQDNAIVLQGNQLTLVKKVVQDWINDETRQSRPPRE